MRLKEIPWTGMTVEERIGIGSYGMVYRVRYEGKEFALKHISLWGDDEGFYSDYCSSIAQGNDEKFSSNYSLSFGQVNEEKDLTFQKPDTLLQDFRQEDLKAFYREAAEALLKEIKVLEKFHDHSHIVQIEGYKITESDKGVDLYILMECLIPFKEYISTHPMGEKEVVSLGIDICLALEECEKEAILHRDLKPENILVTKDGTFKVCDFGVAKNLEKTRASGSVKGTFTYMAPEVYHGRKPDNRSDLYSLGMILYRIMNRGREPFLSTEQRMPLYGEREKALNRRMEGEAILAPVDASPEFAEILLKASAWYPEKRYASAAAMREDLEKLQNGTYKIKNTRSAGTGKRTKSFFRKAGIVAGILLAIMLLCGRILLYVYREYFVNYCDPEILRILEEEYGFSNEARLNGNGTLFIHKDEDLYCTLDAGEYPWMNQKDRIRRLVFEENVSGIDLFKAYDQENYTVFLESGVSRIFRQQMEDGTFQYGTLDPLYAASEYLFSYCKNLEEIEIKGKNFHIAANSMFRGDNALKTIKTRPDADIKVESMGIDVFSECECPWIERKGFCMFGSTLVRYNGTDPDIRNMPDNTAYLYQNAFAGNENIQSIILPAAVREIGTNVFAECIDLRKIELQDGVEIIGGGAFGDCRSLEEISIPAGVREIGESAFSGCESLSDIVISPENPYYIVENGVLYDSEKTTLLWCTREVRGSLQIPLSVNTIHSQAFFDCDLLEELIIPDSAHSSTLSWFGSCLSLKHIEVSENNLYFTMKDGLLYSKDMTQIVWCPRDREGELIIPEGVRAIYDYAFAGCSSLTKIHIADTVSYIMTNAFMNCSGIRTINLPGTLSIITNHAFDGCTGLEEIKFRGSKDSWERLTERFDIGVDESLVVFEDAA